MAPNRPAMQSKTPPDLTSKTEFTKSRFSSRLDYIVNLLKWPSAILALSFTPLVLWSLVWLVFRLTAYPTFSLIPFFCGLVGFWLLWNRWLGKSRFGSFLVTLEHELTHALFALLTFHPIVGFRASLKSGGHVRFAGKGNWLIIAAPYFFPSAAIVLFCLAYFLPFASLPWQSLLMGTALTYHLVSTWRETHRDQNDLRLLGGAFCWMFLPAANLAVVGLLVSFAHAGSEGVREWLASIRQPIDLALQYALEPDSKS